MTLRFLLLLLMNMALSGQAHSAFGATLPANFTAKVIHVQDGDSLTLLFNRRHFEIRLEGIDAPETSQPFGTKAKQYLSDLVFGKPVTGKCKSQELYGRNLCAVAIGSINVNRDLVAQGLAWHYTKYSNDPDLAAGETIARDAKKNLWSKNNPIPPWNWRNGRNYEGTKFLGYPRSSSLNVTNKPISAQVQFNEPSDEQVVSVSHWLNTSSNVRHNKSCRWYKATKHGRPGNANEGRACKICGG